MSFFATSQLVQATLYLFVSLFGANRLGGDHLVGITNSIELFVF